MSTVRLSFQTQVAAPVAQVWAWSTSVKGIKAEMWPILRVRFPKGLTHIDEDTTLRTPLGRCQFLLLGLFPIDMSKLTFAELEPGRRFVEQSPLLSMRSWRHERIVTPSAHGAYVTDHLEFTPRFAAPVVAWFVGRFFAHRHAVLAQAFPCVQGHPCAPGNR